MPYDVAFVPAEQIVRVRAHGEIDVSTCAGALRHVARDPQLESGMKLVMDLREVSLDLSPEECRDMGQLHAQLLSSHRSAVLVSSPLAFGLVRMMAAHATMDGATVMPFYDEGEALAWLRL